MVKLSKTYHEMFVEVESILRELEGDSCDLDMLVVQAKRGQEILIQMDQYLKEAKNTVESLKHDFTESSSSSAGSNTDEGTEEGEEGDNLIQLSKHSQPSSDHSRGNNHDDQ